VEIQPVAQPFQFSLEARQGNASLGSFVGVASQNRLFVLYHKNGGGRTINVNVYNQDVGQLSLTLYGPFPTVSFTGGSGRTIPKVANDQATLNYTADANTFYYISMGAPVTLFQLKPSLRVSFDTDVFACPYGQLSNDYNEVFPRCSTTLPTKGLPCLVFDDTASQCTLCESNYELNSIGACVQSTSCPADQYYDFGQCLYPIAHCTSF
jgi:hypothetical protein